MPTDVPGSWPCFNMRRYMHCPMGAFDTFREVLVSTLPIAGVLLLLQIFITDASLQDIMLFVVCIILVLVGFTVFLMGVDNGINPVGEHIGKEIPKRRSRLFMVGVVFVISFLVTVAEPDVGVFSGQVVSLFPSVNKSTLIYCIAVGVALLLIVAAFRIVYKMSLKVLFTICYLAVIVLAFVTPPEFLAVSFDSGGVTTGPMTVPILLSLGIGICSVGAYRNELDGFGMIGLASVGPIIVVLILGLSMGDLTVVSGTGESLAPFVSDPFQRFAAELKHSIISVATAIVPLSVCFMIFQKILLKFSWNAVKEMLMGLTMASFGVVVFLTAIYVGFIPVATSVGQALMGNKSAIILLGLLLGFLVAFAEPAVAILSERVETASQGMVSKKDVKNVISLGVACFAAIGMAKVCFNINLLYIIIPGYVLSLILMWLSDKDMVGIAFDAGGVSTGPMTVAVISTMYTGIAASMYTGEAAVINGFGIIALIAMAPILFLGAFGVYIRLKKEGYI